MNSISRSFSLLALVPKAPTVALAPTTALPWGCGLKAVGMFPMQSLVAGFATSKTATKAKSKPAASSKGKPVASKGKTVQKSAKPAKPAAKVAKPKATKAVKAAQAKKVAKPVKVAKPKSTKDDAAKKLLVLREKEKAKKAEKDAKLKAQKEKEKERDKGRKEKEREQKKIAQQKEKERAKKEKLKAEKEAKPKRAMSAFMYYVKDGRDAVVKENPDMKLTDVVKELATRWRNMSDAEKQKFEQKANKDRDRYLKERETYLASKPKRMTAYALFMKDMYSTVQKEHPDSKITEVAKHIAARWQGLSDEEKQSFGERAQEMSSAGKA